MFYAPQEEATLLKTSFIIMFPSGTVFDPAPENLEWVLIFEETKFVVKVENEA